MSFLKSAADLILEPSETSGADVPAVKESPDEQALLLLNDVFDALVEACPLDFVDNWIRQIQAAVILGWATIGPKVQEVLKGGTAKLKAAVMVALQGLIVVAAGRPVLKGIARTVLFLVEFGWDTIFAKAQPKLAARGVKV